MAHQGRRDVLPPHLRALGQTRTTPKRQVQPSALAQGRGKIQQSRRNTCTMQGFAHGHRSRRGAFRRRNTGGPTSPTRSGADSVAPGRKCSGAQGCERRRCRLSPPPWRRRKVTCVEDEIHKAPAHLGMTQAHPWRPRRPHGGAPHKRPNITPSAIDERPWRCALALSARSLLSILDRKVYKPARNPDPPRWLRRTACDKHAPSTMTPPPPSEEAASQSADAPRIGALTPRLMPSHLPARASAPHLRRPSGATSLSLGTNTRDRRRPKHAR